MSNPLEEARTLLKKGRLTTAWLTLHGKSGSRTGKQESMVKTSRSLESTEILREVDDVV